MEWRKNRIAIGALLFFVLLGLLAWAINARNRPTSRSDELPTIDIDETKVTRLEITRPGEEVVVLSRDGDVWRVIEPLAAEADRGNVESAMKRLGELRIRRIVATKVDNYARLQVDDENAVRVVVVAGEEPLADLRIGKYGNGMTMLRVDERSEVFGASGSLRYAFDRELRAWRDRRVVSVNADDVQQVRFASPNGVFAFERTENGWSALEGKKALGSFDANQVNGRLSTLARLIASDFAAEDVSEARAGLTEPSAKVSLRLAGEAGPIELELGATTDEGDELYLRRKGRPTIYVISQYLADRLRPDADAFQAPAAPPSPPPAMPGAPPAGGPQQPKLPPEVMEQLREQIRAQQQQQGN